MIEKKKLTFKDITPPPGVNGSGLRLFPYQQEGVKFLLSHGVKVLLSDCPGVGKTPQVIVTANALNPQHIVVICPSVVKDVWRKHFEEWGTHKLPVQVVRSSKDCVDPKARLFILSYDTAKKVRWLRELRNILRSSKNTLLIADEAHYCKGYKTQRNILLNTLSNAAPRAILVTGTPMLKSVGDLYPLIRICENGYTESFHDFCYKYSFAHPTPFGSGVEYRGVRNIKSLRKRLGKFMIRRHKEDVLPQLPRKIYHKIPLDIGRQADEFSLPIQTIREILEGHINHEAENYPALRKALGVTKMPMILEWLDYFYEQYEETTPVVIYAHHKSTIEGIRSHLEKIGKDFAIISGATADRDRPKIVTDFQEGRISVILANIKAGGIGITLTRAHHCVFTELDWTPANISQAIDRLHRIGQLNPVNIHMLIAANTLEEDMVEDLILKLKDTEKVLGK